MRLPRRASGSSVVRQSSGVLASAGAVAGSCGSVPTTTLSMSARSETERVITPPKSCIHTSGITPVPLSSPSVPRRVTKDAPAAGA